MFCFVEAEMCWYLLFVCLSVWLGDLPWQSAWRNLLWKLMLGFHLGQRPWFIPSLQCCSMSYTKPHSSNIYRDSIWYINLQRLYLVLKKKQKSNQMWLKTMVNILTLEIINTLRSSWFCFYLPKNKGIIKKCWNR